MEMHKGVFCAAFLIGATLLPTTVRSQQMIPIEDAVAEAASRSTLAAPNGVPFHLRAKISDETTHDPQYEAVVEEWWQSPTVWRREFHSRAFSQTHIVNWHQLRGPNTGPAFPRVDR